MTWMKNKKPLKNQGQKQNIVNPLVQNSNSLLEDLRRLNQLKDIQNQTGAASPKMDKPTPDQSQSIKMTKKLRR